MKTSKSVKAVIMAVTILCVVGTIFGFTIISLNTEDEYVSENTTVLKDSKLNISTLKIAKGSIRDITDVDVNVESSSLNIAEAKSEEQILEEKKEAERNKVVYEGMTLGELSDKLDRSLKSDLSGQGYTFASYAVEMGVDPYLAVAIVMHETGCNWQCSSLLKQCNNVGGMKAGGEGYCGSYAKFATLEDGIRRFMDNLNRNYFSQGLTTPEAIGPKYAASTTWATQVNTYINSIKAA